MKLDKNLPIVIATTNKDKVKEYQEIFRGFNLLSLQDIGFNNEVEETGKTFDENAYIKANAVYDFVKEKNLQVYVLSDDSGLVVKALGGAPGIYSARFSGPDATYQTNRDLLLEKMKNFKYNFQRKAFLTTHICFVTPEGKIFYRRGKTPGIITKEEIGDKTFGYNCIFFSKILKKTFGQADMAEKSVNHRFKAAKKILKLF